MAKDLQGFKKDYHTGLSQLAGSVVYSLLCAQITQCQLQEDYETERTEEP